MTRSPLLLRGDDPLDSLRAMVERFEATARTARRSYVHSTPPGVGSPLVVIAATGLDGFRVGRVDRDGVELLGDGELLVAAERAGLTGFDLHGEDTERVRGALTALRGSVGEHWVLDRLRDRALPVPEGAVAVEMLPFTTPGVDLVFTDAVGVAVGAANIKVAATADVVMRHFERHPGVGVVYATSDAAADAAARGMRVIGAGDAVPVDSLVVVDIARTSAEFDQQIADTLAGGGGSVAADGANVIDLVPWASSAAIGVRAMLRLRAGMSPRDVARHAGTESAAAGAAATAAHLASRLTSSEPSVALVAMVTSAFTFGALDVRRSWVTLTDQLGRITADAERIVDDSRECRQR